MQTILIIDDELDIREMLAGIFEDEDYNVLKAAHSEQALTTIKNNDIDLIVLDIWLDNSDMDGVQILKHLKSSTFKDIPVLMISGHGNVEMAVNTMKIGAFDFIEKPFKIDHILLTASRALEQKLLKDENQRLKKTQSHAPISNHYKSPAMISLIKQINEDAESDGRLMILGEQGTGKTRIAHLVHENSLRKKNKIITVNAGLMDDNDIDNMLEQANDGTLLIENIQCLCVKGQSHLLNILTQNKSACRIITTTIEQDLKALVSDKKFSSALYDRLSVMEYYVPNLANRQEDIDVLISEFIESVTHEFNIATPTLTIDVVKHLKSYKWHGNIRQLKIAIEWIVISNLNTIKNGMISMKDISFLGLEERLTQSSNNIIPLSKNNFMENILSQPLKQAREEFEVYYLTSMMTHFQGNVAKIADHIDMERTALYRKLKSLDINYTAEGIAK